MERLLVRKERKYIKEKQSRRTDKIRGEKSEKRGETTELQSA